MSIDITKDEEIDMNLENVKEVFALQGKNVGCSVKLRGKVVLITFLINDGESRWDNESEKAAIEMLRSVTTRLMNESKLNKEELQVVYACCQVSLPYVVTRKNSKKCAPDVLRQFGYMTVQEYQQHYESKFSRDETAVTFLFNKDFRSYAHSVDRKSGKIEDENSNGDEYSIVSFDTGNIPCSERTFLHELLHQFGAIDYYYPDVLKFKAEKMLPNSIMNGGEIIDDLTRYLIGWDENPSAVALGFLDAIKFITVEDVEFARRKEFTDS